MKHTELRQLRKDVGLTMADVARLFQVPYRTWQNWELGPTRVPPMAGVILELYKKSLKEDIMNKDIVLTYSQVEALRNIIKPEHRVKGYPKHKVNSKVVDALIDKGLIKTTTYRLSGVNLLVTPKFKSYRYNLIKEEVKRWKI
jgi:transcriptional regulator with XRE-family HTH domain